jgi:hypothetical protein
MTRQMETILLDPDNFNNNTRKWNVPILRVRGVKCIYLYLDGNEIPSNNYSVERNVIGLSENIEINAATKGHIITEFNTRSMLVSFWLPIILAVIGILGSIGQPLLYSFGILYKEELYYAVDFSSWGYNEKSHEFFANIQVTPARTIKHIPESEIDKWHLYLAVREKTTESDVEQYNYRFFSGPFQLSSLMEKSVKTNKEFTELLYQTKGIAQGCIILAKKGIELKQGFRPEDYPDDQLRLIQIASCGVGR